MSHLIAMYRRHRTSWIILILGSAFSGFLWWNPLAKHLDIEKTPPIEVKAWSIEKTHLAPQITLFGLTHLDKYTEIEARVTADVIATHVHPGDWFSQGDTLISLDDRDINSMFDEINAQLDEMNTQIQAQKNDLDTAQKLLAEEHQLLALQQKTLKRQQALNEAEVHAEQQVDNAKITLAQTKLNVLRRQQAIQQSQYQLQRLDAQKKQLMAKQDRRQRDKESTQIKAPFSGRVAQVNTAVGDKVQPRDKLIQLFNYNNLHIKTQIPRQYLSRIIEQNHQNKLTAEALIHGHMFTLELARLSGQISAGNSGMDAYFTVTQGDRKHLILGETILMTIQLSQVADSFLVPLSALQTQNMIYQIQDRQLKPIRLTLQGKYYQNMQMMGWIATSSQLMQGDVILGEPIAHSKTGALIDIKEYLPYDLD